MGLFDHLFKPRPDDSVERVVGAPLKASNLIEMREVGAEAQPPPDPAAVFLQPKGYAPGATHPAVAGQNQGFVPVLPAARRAPLPDRKSSPPGVPPTAASHVVLMVGDVLARIPAAFLRPGPHDLKRELRFRIADLFSDLTRGRPVIALSCIAEQCPELFHTPIGDADDMAIRLPLQKLVEQVGHLRSRMPAAPLPVVPPAARPPVPPPVVAPPPSEPPPPVPPIAEAVVAPSVPIPVPPPVVLPPPPAPEMVTPIASAGGAELPGSPVEIAAEIPLAPASVPAQPPEEVPAVRPGPTEPTIELSLAAIVAKVPREFLAGVPPFIADNYRISLPFQMIERQLGSGSVAISGPLFWSVIPPLLKHHFVLREDLPVPIPLEEIFQNLPVGGVEENHRLESLVGPAPSRPDAETPFVLAPLPVAENPPELDRELAEFPSAPTIEPPAVVAPIAPPPVDGPLSPAPEMSATAEEAPVLAASRPAEFAAPSPANEMPDENRPAFVHLQPFHTFNPPSPTVDPATEGITAQEAAVILGEAPVDPAPASQSPEIPSPADDHPEAAADPISLPGVECAEPTGTMPPPAPLPLTSPPAEEEAPRFKVLPTPESDLAPAAAPPAPDPLEAFTPDQPPPLKIEAPLPAVAVLRATLPGPQEDPVFAAATVNVQPPKIFRPVVLAPPISGRVATPPVNLAPTLAGTAVAATGMISLAPSAEMHSPSPPLEPSAPAAPPPAAAPETAPAPSPVAAPKAPLPSVLRESAPTLKNFVRQVFHLPVAKHAPEIPDLAASPLAEENHPSSPSPPAPPVPTTPEPPPFHLHLPPVPKSVEAPPTHEHAPPALPISRFDQHSLQSLFMTEETLDLHKVSRLSAAFPGIQACIIAAQGKTYSAGKLPEGFDLSALRGLSPQVGAAADRLPIGLLKNFTLYGEQYSVSFFERGSVCLCAIHRARSFIPGVREKLVAVVDELARG